ncbi:probable L-type lectin-domain containing receptor kinase S.5 [Camellia sinensis]|uniref:probable L-type lectin-domain containing receptor kinase S.5 n=1 Tax=Camellia sinensis TaxID=4442 RepID=UPI00103637FF|nr:probable L-type lectin-domain containing receptor kinase S.5 [Camellia sinensis]
MLDSQYNAHIGDFGLARLLQNKALVTTRIAGTPGYLAPEVSFTGRATPESDVYNFGMVVLEVVCGKRSKGIMYENSLVDSVWTLYEKVVDVLLDCVDRLLEGKFDEEEVKRSLIVGLACLHPNFMLRPRMRKVVQVFMNPNKPPLNLSESQPNLEFGEEPNPKRSETNRTKQNKHSRHSNREADFCIHEPKPNQFKKQTPPIQQQTTKLQTAAAKNKGTSAQTINQFNQPSAKQPNANFSNQVLDHQPKTDSKPVLARNTAGYG